MKNSLNYVSTCLKVVDTRRNVLPQPCHNRGSSKLNCVSFKYFVAGEPVSRILCSRSALPDKRRDASGMLTVIIPLGHDSRRDSSSLPEGFICRGLRRRKGERIHFRKR
jgi:hypothetical protein